MTTAQIELPDKLIPVFTGQADYRGAYGGRGSGKTHSFAKMAAVKGYQLSVTGKSGIIVSGREYMNSLDDSSMSEIKAAIMSVPWLADHYEVGEKFIRTKDGRISFSFIGLRHNLDSIKSKARIHLLWVDEAEPVSEIAWQKALPTIRENGSEVWVTWNPERKNSATHKRFRESPPENSKIVELNWKDNPWFPDVLDRRRLEDMEKRPEHYAHIWEGDFVSAVEGAYFAASLTQARAEGRIGHVVGDPLMTYRACWDIGGTGAKSDATAIWIAQFIGREIRVVDYYEAQGQPLSVHINWLRERGYGNAQMVLPHDGSTRDRVHDVSFESALRDAGFDVEVIPNQGSGAARMRIEAARRLFPAIWFNEKTCAAGIEALGWYHEKRDEKRELGLGPDHDWSSHACLVAGTMVDTARGMIPIEEMKIGDQVLTPAGYSNVSNCGISKISTEIMEIILSDGSVINCTPEHRFFTTDKIVRADELNYNDPLYTKDIMSCLKLAKKDNVRFRESFIESFGAIVTGFGKKEACMPLKRTKAFGCFTGSLWNALTGRVKRFPSMETGKTSRRAIGLCGQRGQTEALSQSMKYSFSTAKNTIEMKADIFQGNPLKYPICTELFGSTVKGKSLKGFMSIIKMATSRITLLRIWKSCLSQSIASFMLRPVNGLAPKGIRHSLQEYDPWQQNGTGAKPERNGISSTQKNMDLARVASIRRFRSKQPVYDLTVDIHHCYYANGALVSNSDAFGLMCVVYEKPDLEYRRQRYESQSAFQSSWMSG